MPKSLSVGGRVVDRKGKPLANALVSMLYTNCPGCHDRIIPATKTNKDGLFAMPVETKIGSSLTVLIEQEAPSGFWSPFFADDIALSKAGLKGIPIKVRKLTGTIQLGDVPPTVEYRTLSIDISKLFHISPTELNFDFATLTITKGYIVIYKDITIPASAIHSSTIRLALPKGRWGLLFSIKRGNSRIDEEVIVSKS